MDMILILLACVAVGLTIYCISEGEPAGAFICIVLGLLFLTGGLYSIFVWPPTITTDKFVADRFEHMTFDKPVTVVVTRTSWKWRAPNDQWSYHVLTGCGGNSGQVEKGRADQSNDPGQ